MKDNLQNQSHKRLNILTGEWVLVSPHRSKRPWQGQTDEAEIIQESSYDKNCYLCPGNKRINGEQNPEYENVYTFNNDFAALKNEVEDFSSKSSLLQAKSESGICKVICFSPDHSKSLANLSEDEIKLVIKTWMSEYKILGNLKTINYIQIFENKGAIMGCSNPHPHGQIWAQNSLPNEIIKKDNHQKTHYNSTGKSLLFDYLSEEIKAKERIIYENDSYIVLIPFWAVWPFETMIIPKAHQPSINFLSEEQRTDYANAISKITNAYDKVFNCSFPYSAGIHQAPTNGKPNIHWHWHMSFYPPLLRSSEVKKFMVGYEMFAMPQRDITAEKAAEVLREKTNT